MQYELLEKGAIHSQGYRQSGNSRNSTPYKKRVLGLQIKNILENVFWRICQKLTLVLQLVSNTKI